MLIASNAGPPPLPAAVAVGVVALAVGSISCGHSMFVIAWCSS